MKALSVAIGILVCTGLSGCMVGDPGSPDDQSSADPAPSYPPPAMPTSDDGTVATSDQVVVTPDAIGPCPSGHVCLYQNNQFKGASVSVTPGISIRDFTTLPCSTCKNGTDGNDGTFDNQMSSWQNASDIDYCWFPDSGFNGAPHRMKAHTQNTLPAEYNDHASSLRSGGCQS